MGGGRGEGEKWEGKDGIQGGEEDILNNASYQRSKSIWAKFGVEMEDGGDSDGVKR